ALLKAGPRRLRPILMTSFAMAIGMVPTAIGTGTGSEFRSPMAIAVIGGVITSTGLTLLVVPVIFAGIEKMQLRGIVARLRGRARAGGHHARRRGARLHRLETGPERDGHLRSHQRAAAVRPGRVRPVRSQVDHRGAELAVRHAAAEPAAADAAGPVPSRDRQQ